MKNNFKKLLPPVLQEKLRRIIYSMQLKRDLYLDLKRYSKHSFTLSSEKSKRHYEADLIFYYHKIEKGLSLPNPRPGFGEKNVNLLISKIEYYTKKYGWDEVSLVSLNSLISYYKFNEKSNLNSEIFLDRIEKLEKSIGNYDAKTIVGGVDSVSKKDIDMSKINFKDFANSRYSIRNFRKDEVDICLIKEAVQIAQKSPSVCNRQSARVYIYSDKDARKMVLNHQNGNTGFGENADKILIVTSELKDFRGSNERNQSFIDGGLYSMSLIYALHSQGLGTCALNLSLNHKAEVELKKVANIGESEVLIMMIAVGNIPENLKVASSSRRKIEEILKIY